MIAFVEKSPRQMRSQEACTACDQRRLPFSVASGSPDLLIVFITELIDHLICSIGRRQPVAWSRQAIWLNELCNRLHRPLHLSLRRHLVGRLRDALLSWALETAQNKHSGKFANMKIIHVLNLRVRQFVSQCKNRTSIEVCLLARWLRLLLLRIWLWLVAMTSKQGAGLIAPRRTPTIGSARNAQAA